MTEPQAPCTSRLGVILLNYRGASDTLACLDSLLRSNSGLERVVIADNASPDGSLAALRAGLHSRQAALQQAADKATQAGVPAANAWTEQRPSASPEPPTAWLTLLDNGENRGFAAGNNPGLRLLMAELALTHFWLLNNDTEVPPASVAALRAALAARPGIDLWGGSVHYHQPPHLVQALGGGALNRRTGETRHLGAFLPAESVPRADPAVAAVEAELDYALGACMVASRQWLNKVGLLNEQYFLFYEELDWACRGRAAGLRLGYAPELVVLHKEGASIGTSPDGGSPMSIHHLARSRILFSRRYLGWQAVPGIFMSGAKQLLKFMAKGRWTAARASAQGLWAGLQHPLDSRTARGGRGAV